MLPVFLATPAFTDSANEKEPFVDSLFQEIDDRFPYLRFRGYLSYTLGVDTQWENDHEDRVEGWGTAFMETRMDLTDHLLTVVSAQFHHYLRVNTEADTLYEAELYECFLDILLDRLQFRIGKQVVTWGKTDVFSPLDILNPLDFRNLLDPAPESVKVPVLMLRSTYDFDNWTIEGVYIPFFEPMQFNVFGTDFSFFKHRFPELHFGGFLGLLEQFGWIRFPRFPSPDSLDPRFLQNLQDAVLATDYPDDDFLHGEYALSLRRTWNNLDGELTYFYGWDDLPVYWVNPVLVQALKTGRLDGATLAELLKLVQQGDFRGIAHSDFHRMHMVGGGLSLAWQDFTFSMDSAFFHKRVFYDASFQAFFSPSLFSVLGIDYMYSEKFVFHLQFFDHSLLDSNRDVVGVDPDTYGFVFYYTGTFLDFSLMPELRLVYFLNNQDLFINPRISYSLTNHFSVALGAAFFEGSGPVDLHTFTDLSRFTPISFFSENDWVYLKVQYAF